ncbi:DNA-binding transcriptional regulator [Fructobacillus cardui]|nr:DNA-binding transcriptional regulator [Fructobacillus cardui]
MEFGEHLKQVRKQKGMSQQTLANLLFVTRKTISHWENGKIILILIC